MKNVKRGLSVFLVIAVLISTLAFSSFALNYDEWIKNWDEIRSSNGYITLTPGTDETQMNFSWQSEIKKPYARIVFGRTPDLSDGRTLPSVRSFNLFGFEWSYTATAKNLKPDTTYYYRYRSNGEYSDIYSFTTASNDDLRILFVTDSQIGRSHGDKETVLKNDTFGWTSTLETALEHNKNIDFILSAGDQVEDSYSEVQYSLFESTPVLRNLPVAAVIGNHDFYTPNYKNHFNNPNSDTRVKFKWPAGNGYFFCMNDVLFIVLDSNNFIPCAQEQIVRRACETYPDAKWRVLSIHHSPYSANATNDIANVCARFTVAPFVDKYDIDICLSGHNHSYSRSKTVRFGQVTKDKEVNGVYTNPEGAVYVTGNSASGSNFNDIDEENVLDCCAFYFQSNIPNYSIVDIKDNRLTVTTYEVSENSVVDRVSIVKE